MNDPNNDPKRASENKSGSSPMLFYVMLGLIVALIAVFLILRPTPSGGTSSGSGSGSAKPSRQ